jgi:hypothetical protein
MGVVVTIHTPVLKGWGSSPVNTDGVVCHAHPNCGMKIPINAYHAHDKHVPGVEYIR